MLVKSKKTRYYLLVKFADDVNKLPIYTRINTRNVLISGLNMNEILKIHIAHRLSIAILCICVVSDLKTFSN